MIQRQSADEALLNAIINLDPLRWPGAVAGKPAKRTRRGSEALSFRCLCAASLRCPVFPRQPQLAAVGAEVERTCDSRGRVLVGRSPASPVLRCS